ncbi:Fructosamine-3-kinase [Geodia barretti]|uniref:protein-ribulosamine 3-kinase n=1 Tax=Geodia barretti TaxID=519541 RepID=A0AA35S6R4_GEOBA|nr:Fructosamine-3-kinase [Geodia barretti]
MISTTTNKTTTTPLSLSTTLSTTARLTRQNRGSVHATRGIRILSPCHVMSKALEDFLRSQLSTSVLRPLGAAGGGCISDGRSYLTDSGQVFVKHNTKREAEVMFKGEAASLEAILKTDTLRVPKPVKVAEYPGGGWVLVTEHLNIGSLRSQQAALGRQLARLHLHNISSLEKSNRIGVGEEEVGECVDQFGFICDTCCGLLPMPNEWRKDWVEFYCQMRLGKQLELVQQNYGDREAAELWTRLQRCIPRLFRGITVQPSLLHGDLWSGNAGQVEQTPVAYDPASFYGHHEFDLAITTMFGGFSPEFYSSYHDLIPRADGFSDRSQLYLLFHYLNHWYILD